MSTIPRTNAAVAKWRNHECRTPVAASEMEKLELEFNALRFVIDVMKAEAAKDDAEIRALRAGSAKVCRELRAENAALRQWQDAVANAVGEQISIESSSPEFRPFFAAIDRGVARKLLKQLEALRPCELAGFDRANHTITLHFAEMPDATIGAKWVAKETRP